MDGLLAAGAMVKARTWELIYRKFHVHVGKKDMFSHVFPNMDPEVSGAPLI
jgi:hypothetical protein